MILGYTGLICEATWSHLYNSFKSRNNIDSSLLANQFTLNFITHGLNCCSIWSNEGDTSFFLNSTFK